MSDKYYYSDGIILDYKNDNKILHRLNGPAVELADGTKQWFQNGLMHRLNGPAMERADGIIQWYQNGKLHREDGPAVIFPEGKEEYWINDVQIFYFKQIKLPVSRFNYLEI